ncbi:hypothetical protein PR003_g15771 [Phytophthora rubi]|uniref:Uncharacterized protein n=1 Tax=Phytophthora rubi TaxID=129364 RepID=A0A6A4EVC9_9STRA|nr:hypothetical protein PR001_g23067 [Phytophthora rubi]KAE9328483.1 hypothetical protein PR003_g15771 [Phytophthora rubi]
MQEWVLTKGLPQEEIEERLRFFTFESSTRSTNDTAEQNRQSVSYAGAVAKGLHREKQGVRTQEQHRMYELCTQQMPALTKLRDRTEDEDKALLMILTHELEVPAPPSFLEQSMTAEELAIFTDVFMALEYPMYAHLVPGQRFGENMSKAALMAQIYVGAEAAPAQKKEIAEFKTDVSRMTLDTKTRVITVTFKGKQTASKWAGWKFPLAAKLLTLEDHESKREAALVNHHLVRLDYYSFTVEVRTEKVTSTDLYWLLAKALGFQVQSMVHTQTEAMGINDKQWKVRIKADACPKKLRETAVIGVEEVELVVHHHEIFINWPCKNCYAPGHPTKFCKADEAQAAQLRKVHKHTVKGKLPSNKGQGGRNYSAADLPRTLEQLTDLLKVTTTKNRGRR